VNDDEGAGTALAVAVVAAVVVLFALLATVAVVLDAHRRVEATADAAALAGADTALGNATGLPCARAAGITAAAGLRLDRCEQRDTLVRVRASTSVLGLPFVAEAVAGPPPRR
jgi:secretion/DNA translocation related TadE-like protein